MKLYLIGGFLGSGKTTAIRHACTILMDAGRRVAVVTNDQGSQLVDTGFLSSFGIPTREVTNGCFCCNYAALTEAVEKFAATVEPEIIFAESVGSCTDLVATIAKPLQRFQPELEVVISVFADASLIHKLFTGNASFINDEVRYIFKKQLKEADVLIINKVDLLATGELTKVQALIESDYPDKTVLYQDSLEQGDVVKWLDTISGFKLIKERSSLELDYGIYGKGEAMMAWLDESIEIVSAEANCYQVAMLLVNNIHAAVARENYFIGHLKFLLDNGVSSEKISFTATASPETMARDLYPPTSKLSVLINARIQADHKALEKIIADSISAVSNEAGCSIRVLSLAAFQPGYPTPTHRFSDNLNT